MVQYGWYMQNGNRTFLESQKEYLVELLRYFAGCIKENGSEDLPENRFVDWPTADKPDVIHAGLQGIMRMAFRAGEFLCAELGDGETAKLCRDAFEKLGRHIPEHYANKQAAALLVSAGLADPVKTTNLILKRGGARGFSTFMGYYMLCAIGEAGDLAAALNILREYWGAMLSRGATTFWEDFDLEWTRNAYGIDQLPVPGKDDIHGDFGKHCYTGLRHSLCHGWAGGPAAFLTEKVLGIRPAAPGFVQAKIEPCLGGLTRVEGSQPTPFGEIELSVRKIGNKERRLLKLPKEVREV